MPILWTFNPAENTLKAQVEPTVHVRLLHLVAGVTTHIERVMKRHPGLQALSQHHHFALIQTLQLRRATDVPQARRPAALSEAAENFLRFWQTTGQQHFQEEEEVLLIAYGRHSPLEQDARALRMLTEHVEIRAQVEQLEAALEAGSPREEAVAQLARALHDHVRFEENEFFPHIESTLGEAALLALAGRLTRLHAKDPYEI